MTPPRAWPAGLAPMAAIYWVAVALLAWMSVGRTGGHLVYPLDDAYVHMAMAKHAALQGVWGVTSEHFSSSSSSPLWTALLAATYRLTGVSDVAPLVLNVVAGTAVLVSLDALLRGYGLARRFAGVWMAVVIFAGTLPTLTVMGMEHTLHVLVTLWFVCLGARVVAQGPAASRRETTIVWLLAAIVTLTRYEGLFAVAVVSAGLFFTKRWPLGAAVALAGAVPVLLYGAWSQAHGGFLLPNSVLLKAAAPGLTLKGALQLLLLWPALTALADHAHLLVLAVATLGLLVGVGVTAERREKGVLALMFLACLMLHLQFARVGWFFRYETYLVVLGLVTIGAWLAEARQIRSGVSRRLAIESVAVAVLAGLLGFPLARRGANALRQTPAAASNIYQQQYQVGQFLDAHYRGRRVAVNDVGAVGYLADVKLLDVWGLASNDTAALRLRGAYTTQALADMATKSGVAIAIIYPSWLGEFGGVPGAWTKVGAWGVADNVVLGENAMSFYAVAPGSRDPLVANLVAFRDRLPAEVLQSGDYQGR